MFHLNHFSGVQFVALSAVILVYSCHCHSTPECFPLPHLKFHTCSTVSLHCSSSHPQASAITLRPSVPVSLTSLDALSECNCAIFVLLGLAYFTLSSSFIHITMHITMPFLFFLKLICLLYFGCGGSLLLCVGFSLQRLLLLSTDSRREGFRSCGAGAWLVLDMWDLPRPGIKPVFPAQTGRFFLLKFYIYFLIEG